MWEQNSREALCLGIKEAERTKSISEGPNREMIHPSDFDSRPNASPGGAARWGYH